MVAKLYKNIVPLEKIQHQHYSCLEIFTVSTEKYSTEVPCCPTDTLLLLPALKNSISGRCLLKEPHICLMLI